MSQMKAGYHPNLLEILSDKKKFLIPYSTSHIGDIFSSYSEEKEQKKRIEKDLEFIASLTDNWCLSNNGKQVILENEDPKLLFQQRVNEKDFLNTFSIETLIGSLGENELTKKMASDLTDLLKSFPLGAIFKDAFENPESRESLDLLLPGFKENPTMEGLMNSFLKLYHNLNYSEDYKALRELIQKGLGINRDKIYNAENPYDFITEAHKKLGTDLKKYVTNSQSSPEWFMKISNEYLKLDMHGYQEDKIKVKENKRKETFKNTTEDAFHAAFASTCNFYIINDHKSYNKTKKVYEKLEINTNVFKPDEFVSYYKKYLNINRTVEYFKIAVEIIKTYQFSESKTENGIQRIYLFPYFLFDFFNKIIIAKFNNSEKPVIVLSKSSPTNGNVTYFLEIKVLVKMLNEYFGEDKDKRGEISYNEFQNKDWEGRIWQLGDIQFKLTMLNGYIQLYFGI